MRSHEMMASVTQDLRFALRTLRRDLRFTALAILIIAFGIGASVTVFSVANALLLRPLPFKNPERLAWVANGGEGLSGQTAQVGPYLSYAKLNRSFSDVAAYFAFYGIGDTKLEGEHGVDPVRLSEVPVSANFFPLLGIVPEMGRGFTPEEATFNGPNAVLISHSLWERRFASNPAIVGRPIILNGSPWLVIGVLPASFDFGSVFAPGTHIDLFSAFPLGERTDHWGNTLAIVGRLKPGATIASANAELKTLVPQIRELHRRSNSFEPTISALREHVSGRTRAGLVALIAAVGALMLIVCANLSNLLLARAATRQQEMAVRAALGAGRRRLVRQMLTESLLLSSCGAALGFVFAIVGTRAIAGMDAVSLPLLGGVSVDVRAWGVTVALALAAGIAFGLVPALHMSEGGVYGALKSSGRAVMERGGQWTRRSLVVAEVALAGILLVGSALLIRSFENVLDVDLGFRPDHVISLRVDPDASRGAFKTDGEFVAFVDEVLQRTRRLPGVTEASIADGLPLGSNRSWGVGIPGEAYVPGKSHDAYMRMASDGFVKSMGMRLIAGRDLSSDDVKTSEPVVVINETMAKTFWPNESAVGKIVDLAGKRRVVGVVGDVRHLALEEGAGLEAYLSIRQVLDYSSLTLIVRTSTDPAAAVRSIRTALVPMLPNLATNTVRTLQDIVDRSVSPRRFFTSLVSGFSVFALCLALLGIYGVVSYTVTHRTQEIGLRIALGASSRQVETQIVRDTVKMAVAGIAIGVVGAWAAARILKGFLFGVSGADPVSYAVMIAVLGIVAIVSGYLPARRAARIDPMVALRDG